MNPQRIARYGWKKDRLDYRDLPLMLPEMAPLHSTADLRSGMPPIYDQGQEGSCTGNSTAAAVDYELHSQGLPFLTPSRQFLYYNGRAYENGTGEDSGAQIRDVVKGAVALGVCPEPEWPYLLSNCTVKPTPECYRDALGHRTTKYNRVQQNGFALKHALAILKKPVIFGFSVFDAFESAEVAKTGIVPLPDGTQAPIGGHAVLLAGYDDHASLFLVRNSWGAGWGQQGYFQMPYGYILNPHLAHDFWVITQES